MSTVLQGRNVLKKEPMGKDISETDVFSFNEEFHNKLYKIKIATVSAQKESEPEKIETRHKVSHRDGRCWCIHFSLLTAECMGLLDWSICLACKLL